MKYKDTFLPEIVRESCDNRRPEHSHPFHLLSISRTYTSEHFPSSLALAAVSVVLARLPSFIAESGSPCCNRQFLAWFFSPRTAFPVTPAAWIHLYGQGDVPAIEPNHPPSPCEKVSRHHKPLSDALPRWLLPEQQGQASHCLRSRSKGRCPPRNPGQAWAAWQSSGVGRQVSTAG